MPRRAERRLRWWLHVGPNVTPRMRYLPPLSITLLLDTSRFDAALRELLR